MYMLIISMLCYWCVISGSTVGQVWFTAMRKDGNVHTEPDPANPLLFPDNISSLGPGYDPVTSIFTAPVRGLYFFIATVQQNNDDDYFYLALNNVYIRHGRLDAATDFNTATVNSILMLEAGDRVHVEVAADDQIRCWYCNFDGYLLYESI